ARPAPSARRTRRSAAPSSSVSSIPTGGRPPADRVPTPPIPADPPRTAPTGRLPLPPIAAGEVYREPMAGAMDDEVTALARRIAELGWGEKARIYAVSWWCEPLLGGALSDPSSKTQLFRLADMFAATVD